MKNHIAAAGAAILDGIDRIGLWLGVLGLRLLLGWEFFESGLEKYRGENWFADIQDRFPFPFSIVPPQISWQMATWFEIVGGLALVLGLGTRFFGVSLFVLTSGRHRLGALAGGMDDAGRTRAGLCDYRQGPGQLQAAGHLPRHAAAADPFGTGAAVDWMR
jgi:hypothetical protein